MTGSPAWAAGACRPWSSATAQALFGPVLIEPPTGPPAVRLWHLITGWLEFPQLYEVQRPKSQQDLTAIAQTFRPYLEARDWVTIQKETP